MLEHEHPANQQQMQFLPHFFETLDKAAAETLGEEKRRAAIGAGSDELQCPGL
jgi:hypothetical protein